MELLWQRLMHVFPHVTMHGPSMRCPSMCIMCDIEDESRSCLAVPSRLGDCWIPAGSSATVRKITQWLDLCKCALKEVHIASSFFSQRNTSLLQQRPLNATRALHWRLQFGTLLCEHKPNAYSSSAEANYTRHWWCKQPSDSPEEILVSSVRCHLLCVGWGQQRGCNPG
ncbi:unnamed protein product [Effrenium voratum]|uniref:Uncharacterized protein n=1 Tax=Effrenium voratum TaxID=2562239 RepID=A0AA36N111_9DINO|nr:unnamed protein product [Effrenium voratum]